MKQCAKCKEYRIEREFQKDRTTKDGYDYNCKSCNSAESKALWASEKGKKSQQARSRKYELRRLYGITLQQYEIMFIEQNGSCAICSIKQEEVGRNFDVDHDHKTGIVRGLLCVNCNTALGLLKEDKNRAEKMFQYLEHNSSKNTRQEQVTPEDVLRTAE